MIDDDLSMNDVYGSGTGETGEAALPGRHPAVWKERGLPKRTD